MNTIQQYNSMQPTEVLEQIQQIQHLMETAMKKDEHFGVIPGTQKPTLYKAGAEKLSLMFRLAPEYQIDKESLGDVHREYEVICTLKHINTGATWGQGVGVCSTMESKYRWRESKRLCPMCGKDTIIKGKAEYGGGWLCFAKKGGCGAKFNENDDSIIAQTVGRIENEDIADIYNTVKKMAKKRAYVDAMLTATAASDIFAQDLEDLPIGHDIEHKTEQHKPENQTGEETQKPAQENLTEKYDKLFKGKSPGVIKKIYLSLPKNEQGKDSVACKIAAFWGEQYKEQPETTNQKSENVQDAEFVDTVNQSDKLILAISKLNGRADEIENQIDLIADLDKRKIYTDLYKNRMNELHINCNYEMLPY